MIHIAIDGPAASGKGSVARGLSERLGIPCLDTGAIYRGVAVWAREYGTVNLSAIRITAKIVDGITRVYLDGNKDVTDKLRDFEISLLSSQLAHKPEVRALCTRIAQQIALDQSLIAEGRDICTVVLPNAKYKFYIDGDIKVRAQRRLKDLQAKGENIPFKEVLKQMKKRDRLDRSKRGGLRKNKEAIRIDATNMTVDENVEYMLSYIQK